jgi:hypothetical protein
MAASVIKQRERKRQREGGGERERERENTLDLKSIITEMKNIHCMVQK